MKINLFLVFILVISSCKGQENNTHMDTFDKLQFDKEKVNGEYRFVQKDGKAVRQMENTKRMEYTEEISDPVTPYTRVSLYYMLSGQPKVKGGKFYDMPIGKWEYYDENGKLTKEVNWEAPYKVSVEELSKIMKGMNVDIMKRNTGVDVDRQDDPVAKYIVAYPVGRDRPYEIYSVYVDGKTGKILDKTTSSVKH